MISGEFYNLPTDLQSGWLAQIDMVYLGRGECIWGMVESGALPKDFPDEMRLAKMMYCLSLPNVEDEAKDWLRKRIADILNS